MGESKKEEREDPLCRVKTSKDQRREADVRIKQKDETGNVTHCLNTNINRKDFL